MNGRMPCWAGPPAAALCPVPAAVAAAAGRTAGSARADAMRRRRPRDGSNDEKLLMPACAHVMMVYYMIQYSSTG